ncbi:ABC transporter permease [Bifidobacterium dolichotidis]|uniref:ABC transporter permease n=1 Tax=Bifidobacterium dolichotidis TaxID=2306976 RepID=A0A430FRF5_9BIFI|nr:ABC transporter permease [Bifidobacterium dolichotidis]RSX55461.1 ABC transporter permease [Bifidobacterium dolichotidis]
MSSTKATRVARARHSHRTGGNYEWRGLTFGGALRSEFIKAMSLKSTYVLLITNAALLIASAVLVAAFMSAIQVGEVKAATLWSTTAGGVTPCMLVVAILGAMNISSEFSTNSVQMSLVAVPRRGMYMLAKIVTVFVLALVSSLVGLLIAAGVSIALFEQDMFAKDAFDGILPYTTVFGGALALAMIAVMSLGIGALLRTTVSGILTIIGLIEILPTVLNLFMFSESVSKPATIAQHLLPRYCASQFMSGGYKGVNSSDMELTQNGVHVFTPTWGGAGLILLGWVVLALALGFWRMRRSDI